MGDIQGTPFIRELASSGERGHSDRRTRDRALESLTLFLRSRRDLQLVELLKVWKGLFFCFYHSDRPLTQQCLAHSLSYSLLPTLPESMVQRFLRAFWITMSRDFHSLDRLRLDKYLYLLRCYVGAAFELFLNKDKYTDKGTTKKKETKNKNKPAKDSAGQSNGSSKKRKRDDEGEDADTESAGELDTYLRMLQEGPLCPFNFDVDDEDDKSGSREAKMPKGPDGIRYHLMDIWLDEIEKCATEPDESGAGAGDGAEKGGDSDEDEDAEGENGSSQRTKLKKDIPMELLLRPIVRMHEESPNRIARKRAAEVLGDERLVEWGVRERKEERGSDDSDDEWAGFD